VRFRIIDRNRAPVVSSRGIGIHPRTLELLSLHGLARAFVKVGLPQDGLYFYEGGQRIAGVDFTLAPSPYQTIAIPQAESERIFRAAVERTGAAVEWDTELLDIRTECDGVVARVRGTDGAAELIRADWLIGCDGARSTVRTLMDVSFEGDTYPEVWGLADCRVPGGLPTEGVHVYRDADGRQVVVIPLGGDRYRLQIDRRPEELAGEPPTLQEMDREVRLRTTLHTKIASVEWASPYRLHRRIADRYSAGRVLIAGDAAHIHSPYGAQGLNTGIQDGLNLGWKLGLVAKGRAGPALLGSYEAERRPIALKVIELSHALLRHTRDIAGDPNRSSELAAIVSGCAANYRNSPLTRQGRDWPDEGIRPGDRVPDIVMPDETRPDASLYRWLANGLVTVLLFAGGRSNRAESLEAAAKINARWAGSAQCFLVDEESDRAFAEPAVMIDRLARLRASFGLNHGHAAAAVIRPDAYLGFGSCRGTIDEVDRYLSDSLELWPV
jgi:2-polyprenyl-6-methoxyphenol hydroxylase-like FAD-dependent oxidoreductase